MKNEIKEILSLLNSSSWSNEAKKIEDYITNLQQYYKDNVNRYEELIEKYSNLQQENERLKKYEKGYCFLKENCMMCSADKEIKLELEDYKYRCEKAIEYINKLYNLYYEQGINFEIMYKSQVDNLLNILQNGSDSQC